LTGAIHPTVLDELALLCKLTQAGGSDCDQHVAALGCARSGRMRIPPRRLMRLIYLGQTFLTTKGLNKDT